MPVPAPIPTLSSESLWKVFVSIPYVKGVLDALAQTLLSHSIFMVLKPHTQCTNFQQLLSHSKNNVRYRVRCRECPMTYVGETGKVLKTWEGSCNGNFKASALAEHVWHKSYMFNEVSTVAWDSRCHSTLASKLCLYVIRNNPWTGTEKHCQVFMIPSSLSLTPSALSLTLSSFSVTPSSFSVFLSSCYGLRIDSCTIQYTSNGKKCE